MCSIMMEQTMEQPTGSETAPDGASDLRVPLFHRSIVYRGDMSQVCDRAFPAYAWNGGTEMPCFEWGGVFHHVFHCYGTVEQTGGVAVPMAGVL